MELATEKEQSQSQAAKKLTASGQKLTLNLDSVTDTM
jgi:hypothetical protein